MNWKGISVEVPVAGGMCTLHFRPGFSTGGEDYSPGVGFDLTSDGQLFGPNKDGKWYGGTGVIGRKDAAILVTVLENFLHQYPPHRPFKHRPTDGQGTFSDER